MTLSALGIFSAAGAGGVVASSYELIETYVLGSSQASVVFSNLGTYSSTYKHLQLRMVLRGDRNAGAESLVGRLNGDSGANYAMHTLTGSGSSVISAAEANATFYEYTYFTDGGTSTIFTPVITDILDAYSTTKNKTIRTMFGRTDGFGGVALVSGLWRSTSSITSITYTPRYGTNFVAGSRFSLYGIKG